MADCGFKCKYQDSMGECEALDGECIGDMCESWKDCECCEVQEDCNNAGVY